MNSICYEKKTEKFSDSLDVFKNVSYQVTQYLSPL